MQKHLVSFFKLFLKDPVCKKSAKGSLFERSLAIVVAFPVE